MLPGSAQQSCARVRPPDGRSMAGVATVSCELGASSRGRRIATGGAGSFAAFPGGIRTGEAASSRQVTRHGASYATPGITDYYLD